MTDKEVCVPAAGGVESHLPHILNGQDNIKRQLLIITIIITAFMDF
jgi:hypothetical protein